MTHADWTDEQLERMEQVGNARSNEFFEERLPSGTVEALTESCVHLFLVLLAFTTALEDAC